MEKLYHNNYHGYPWNHLASLFPTKAIPFINLFKYRGCTVSFKYQVFQEFACEDLNKQQTNTPATIRLSEQQSAHSAKREASSGAGKMIEQFPGNLVDNMTAKPEYQPWRSLSRQQ